MLTHTATAPALVVGVPTGVDPESFRSRVAANVAAGTPQIIAEALAGQACRNQAFRDLELKEATRARAIAAEPVVPTTFKPTHAGPSNPPAVVAAPVATGGAVSQTVTDLLDAEWRRGYEDCSDGASLPEGASDKYKEGFLAANHVRHGRSATQSGSTATARENLSTDLDKLDYQGDWRASGSADQKEPGAVPLTGAIPPAVVAPATIPPASSSAEDAKALENPVIPADAEVPVTAPIPAARRRR